MEKNKSCFSPVFGRGLCLKKKGFTLIEILVVVLIIGILGAIALPQYQRALLKSRYAALMPIAKAMSDSNEAYFLEHGNYAGNAQDLPIQGRNSYPDGTALEFGTLTDYAYVLAKNQDKIPNNTYVVYQKHSLQYPGEIHCEALADNSLAEGVCKSFGATRHIGPTITPTHNTWLLEGSRGAGIEPEAFEDDVDENGQKVFNCDKATQLGYSCEMTENEDGSTTKKICNTTDLTFDGKAVCRSTTLNTDGTSFSVTCAVTDSGECTTYLGSGQAYMEYFDDKGRLIRRSRCPNSSSDRVTLETGCSAPADRMYYTYDEDDRLIKQRHCYGSCTELTNGYDSYDILYDKDGNKIAQITCLKTDIDAEQCSGSATYYAYDEKGNYLGGSYYSSCSEYNDQGVCVATQSDRGYHYVYNDDGKPAIGIQSKTPSPNDIVYVYDYNSKGDRIARYECAYQYAHNDGTCDQYLRADFYSYDQNKNLTSRLGCKTVAANKTCSEYYDGSYGHYYATYDGNGNISTLKRCKVVVESNGNCSEYSPTYHYVYDESGNFMYQRSCSGSYQDSNGNCIGYNYTSNDQDIPEGILPPALM